MEETVLEWEVGVTGIRNMLAVVGVSTLLAMGTASGAAGQDVKIGVVTALAGPYANYGRALTNAVKLAMDDLSAQNFFGATKVQVIYEDNRSDKQEAISLITRLATRDNAVAIIGPASSGEGMAAGPVAVHLKIPLISQGVADALLALGPWVFKSPLSPSAVMRDLARYTIQTIKPASCLFVSVRDNEAYILQKNVLRGLLEPAGIKTVGDESILASESDFTALSTKIVAARPDCLYVTAPVEVAANVILQAKQAGLPDSTVLLGDPNHTSAVYTKIGGAAVEGTVAAAWFEPDGINDFARAFVRNYTQRYGLAPDAFAADGYTTMMVLAHAIRKAGPNPTRDGVRQALAETRDVPGVLGNGLYSLAADRSPDYNSVVLKLKNGKWIRP